jgi:hypothetical protein
MRKIDQLIKLVISFLMMLAIAGCVPASEAPPRLFEPEVTTSLALPTSTSTPAPLPSPRTLKTLEKVDDYPLYTMTYYGDYRDRLSSELNRRDVAADLTFSSQPAWGCSLFAALGDEHNMLYGRNFDWEHSPALLLFTNEPGGIGFHGRYCLPGIPGRQGGCDHGSSSKRD